MRTQSDHNISFLFCHSPSAARPMLKSEPHFPNLAQLIWWKNATFIRLDIGLRVFTAPLMQEFKLSSVLTCLSLSLHAALRFPPAFKPKRRCFVS